MSSRTLNSCLFFFAFFLCSSGSRDATRHVHLTASPARRQSQRISSSCKLLIKFLQSKGFERNLIQSHVVDIFSFFSTKTNTISVNVKYLLVVEMRHRIGSMLRRLLNGKKANAIESLSTRYFTVTAVNKVLWTQKTNFPVGMKTTPKMLEVVVSVRPTHPTWVDSP